MESEKVPLTKEFLEQMIVKITKAIGFGFPEMMYQRAIDYELRNHLYIVQQEVNIDVVYGLIHLGSIRADLVVDDNYIIELKAVDKLKEKHRCQLKRYLKVIGKKMNGFLINISHDKYEIEEISD